MQPSQQPSDSATTSRFHRRRQIFLPLVLIMVILSGLHAQAAGFSLIIEGNEVPLDALIRDRGDILFISVGALCEASAATLAYDSEKYKITITRDDRRLSIKLRSEDRNRAVLAWGDEFKTIGMSIIAHEGDVFVPVDMVSKWLDISTEYTKGIMRTSEHRMKSQDPTLRFPHVPIYESYDVWKQSRKPNEYVPQEPHPGFNLSCQLYEPRSVFGHDDRTSLRPMFGGGVNYHLNRAFTIEFRFGHWSDHYSWVDSDFNTYWDGLETTYNQASWPGYTRTNHEITVNPLYLHLIYRIGAEPCDRTRQRGFPYVGLGYGFYQTEIIADHADSAGVNALGHRIDETISAPHVLAGFEYFCTPNLSFRGDFVYHFSKKNYELHSSNLSGGSDITGLSEAEWTQVVDSYLDRFNNSDIRLDLRGFAWGLSFTFRF